MMTVTISRTDLARNTREIVDRVQKGQPVVVQSYGEDQVVLLDALDYRILRAVVNYAVSSEVAVAVETTDEALNDVIRAYLDKQISLAKAAEQLSLSRFDLMERFERLGVPLRVGPASMEEARDEVKAARQGKTSKE
jgi:prevent-host-death family protein